MCLGYLKSPELKNTTDQGVDAAGRVNCKASKNKDNYEKG